MCRSKFSVTNILEENPTCHDFLDFPTTVDGQVKGVNLYWILRISLVFTYQRQTSMYLHYHRSPGAQLPSPTSPSVPGDTGWLMGALGRTSVTSEVSWTVFSILPTVIGRFSLSYCEVSLVPWVIRVLLHCLLFKLWILPVEKQIFLSPTLPKVKASLGLKWRAHLQNVSICFLVVTKQKRERSVKNTQGLIKSIRCLLQSYSKA